MAGSKLRNAYITTQGNTS